MKKVLADVITIDAGRNGLANSVVSPTYRRGGAAGDSTPTFQQGCGENIGRRFRRERVSGSSSSSGGEDKKSTLQEAEIKGLRPRLSSCERSSEERQEKKDKVTRQEERVVLRKIGTWIVRRRSRTKRSCMSRDKGCRSNCDISPQDI